MVTVKCEWCGKEMERHPYRLKNSRKQFCCIEHKAKWMATIRGKNHWHYNHEKRACPQCGKEFEAFPSEKKKFCSLDCFAASRKQRAYCVVCGKEVSRPRQKYCSRECMGIDRHKRIKKICPICGKEFYIRPCESRGERNVCSKACSDALKREYPMVSDEEMTQYLISLKERLGRIPNLNDLRAEMEINKDALHWSLYVRRGGLRYWQKKLFGKTTYYFTWETSCIDMFNNVLGYPDYKTQKTFKWLKNYDNGKTRPGVLRIDLFYPKYNLCVEFDGEGHFQQINWRKGGNEPLEVAQSRDKLKDKLIRQHGLKLLRFRYDEPLTTEHIKKRLSQFIDFI